MISINNLSIHFTGTDLFSNVSFQVNDRDRVGLVGKNGSGKSTLLNIISGLLTPQQGDVVLPSGATLGYLRQEMETGSHKTIIEEALTAFDETRKLEKHIQKLNTEIGNRTDYESKDYHRLIQQLTEANDRFQLIGGQTMEGTTEKVLMGLGFKRSDFTRQVKEFSSGWQMRVELAKILLQKPDIILLDEPTNHLDIESIQWLEEFLSDYFGSVLLVSHDRAFLDAVTNRTIEIEFAKIYDYKASYSDYVTMREERVARQAAAYSNQQKQIRQIERFIERFRYKNTKAKQVQSRVKMLERMDEIEIEDKDQSSIRFSFPPAPRAGKVVLEGLGLSKSYGGPDVLHNIDFAIINSDKVAFVGKNGEGKTTLSRVIIGELEHTGTLKYGHNVQIGYFAQNQGDYLDPEKTVFETIDDIATGDIRKQVRSILGSFLFSGDTIDKKVKVLSGGEKSRLSLAKLLLTPSNLLVLDEPTNHLDMQSKDILKNALLQFDGTLIIVSHDRDFLQGLTNKVFEFKDRKIREHLGDIYDFLEYRKMKTLKELEQAKQVAGGSASNVSENKLNYERRKQLERDIRKTSNQVGKHEEAIEKLEQEIEAKQKILSDPAGKDIDFNQISKEINALNKKLEAEMLAWEEAHQKLEYLQAELSEN
ncbi:MAG TPA: ABC-F family ATP-binding cassette domain-containing protein [Bacteroidales bacterium]|nr:ABC-F family ATP-binding cassette domain-containing protein [Bacteroidales bacterium]HRX96174.1 ABC-F family ATP-binding cassette domain-containing protein [Bacteroidales bacterium]